MIIFLKKIQVQEKSRMTLHKARHKEGITVLFKSKLPPHKMRLSSCEKQTTVFNSKVSSKDMHTYPNSLLYRHFTHQLFKHFHHLDLRFYKKCFCSVSSFAMKVLGLAKQVST